ncbi:hypothetical protein AAL_08438 [Moelleriella libera RCEF 2490]|uniref:Uncharacterized protein n=1 Tax=Moelleriella libera RCEF 2490 TaxID=1081109 RepID=A0A167V6D2_9HYPO|nr:hypothetical protein AAL_08438 [Moelleriella libera RCEF 2490]
MAAKLHDIQYQLRKVAGQITQYESDISVLQGIMSAQASDLESLSRAGSSSKNNRNLDNAKTVEEQQRQLQQDIAQMEQKIEGLRTEEASLRQQLEALK